MNIHLTLNNAKFGSRIFKQTKSLTKKGIFDKIIVYGLWDENVVEEQWLTDKILIKRLKLKTRGLSKSLAPQIIKYIELIFRILKLFKKNNGTVFTAHSIGTLPIGVIVKWVYNIKLVYDAHEFETERTGLTGIRKKFAIRFERFLIKYVDSILIVNQTYAKKYIEMYDLDENIFVVYNCPFMSLSTNRFESNILRERHEIPDEKEVFLYQGAFNQGRGIDMLLKIFSEQQFENKVLIFMGYGNYLEKVVRYANQFDNIYYQEAVPMDKISEYSSSADVGLTLIENISLSYYYCLPNKLFEYILSGLPVLASNFPEMQSVVEKYEVGKCIDPADEANLIQLIRHFDWKSIKVDDQKIKEIAAVYSWEQQEEPLLKAYSI